MNLSLVFFSGKLLIVEDFGELRTMHKIDAGVKIGSTLGVSDKYFERCHAVLLEIGLKLGQAVLRKIFPEKLYEIDSNVNNILLYQKILIKCVPSPHL